jgi:hypothetical protein
MPLTPQDLSTYHPPSDNVHCRRCEVATQWSLEWWSAQYALSALMPTLIALGSCPVVTHFVRSVYTSYSSRRPQRKASSLVRIAIPPIPFEMSNTLPRTLVSWRIFSTERRCCGSNSSKATAALMKVIDKLFLLALLPHPRLQPPKLLQQHHNLHLKQTNAVQFVRRQRVSDVLDAPQSITAAGTANPMIGQLTRQSVRKPLQHQLR